MSLFHHECGGLLFTACTYLFAAARLGKKHANLVQELDRQLEKNKQLLKKHQHLMGEIASLRDNPAYSKLPVEVVRAADHLTEKNEWLREQNKQVLADVATLRNKLSETS